MTKRQKKIHKLYNALREGRLEGWIIPLETGIRIASFAPKKYLERINRLKATAEN